MNTYRVVWTFIASGLFVIAIFFAVRYGNAQTACPTGNEMVSNNGASTCGNAPATTAAVYNSSGLISAPKVWVGTASVNSSGQWSANISSAGFSSVTNVQVSPVSASNSGIVANASYSCSTTSCSGTVIGATNLLGVLTLALTNVNGSTVSLQIYGN